VGEFDWNEANLMHIARHDVTPAEVEEVFERDPYIEYTHTADNGEERFVARGITARSRYLNIPYTERNERIRPITAFDMTRREIKQHAPKIHSQK